MSNSTNPNAARQPNRAAPLDCSALVAPIDRGAVREFRSMSQLGSERWAGQSPRKIVYIVVGIIVVVIFVNVLSSVYQSMLTSNGYPGASLVQFLTPVLLITAGAVTALAMWTTSRTRWSRRYRLDSFATANGLVAHTESAESRYNGVIFKRGNARTRYEHVTPETGRFFDIGNYRYTTGSGDDKKFHEWGYLAIKLDRRLPHMVLDARANNGIFGGSNLPTQFTKDQVLSLEGDFGKYFTLYCPREYERDALYIFTPDLMALLIDNAAFFDVEIVEDWMFVYSRRVLDTMNPSMWQRMFQIVHTVGAKTLAQSENYRDERVAATRNPAAAVFAASTNTIAPQGQRLRKRVNWVSIVLTACVAAYFFYSFVLR